MADLLLAIGLALVVLDVVAGLILVALWALTG